MIISPLYKDVILENFCYIQAMNSISTSYEFLNIAEMSIKVSIKIYQISNNLIQNGVAGYLNGKGKEIMYVHNKFLNITHREYCEYLCINVFLISYCHFEISISPSNKIFTSVKISDYSASPRLPFVNINLLAIPILYV